MCPYGESVQPFFRFGRTLWDALNEVFARSADFLLSDMDEIEEPAGKLEHFRTDYRLLPSKQRLVQTFWMEKLQGERPDSNIRLTTDTVKKYVMELTILFSSEFYNAKLTNDQSMYVFHTVHCYLYGEISIFISGRGLIPEEKEFRDQCSEGMYKAKQAL